MSILSTYNFDVKMWISIPTVTGKGDGENVFFRSTYLEYYLPPTIRNHVESHRSRSSAKKRSFEWGGNEEWGGWHHRLLGNYSQKHSPFCNTVSYYMADDFEWCLIVSSVPVVLSKMQRNVFRLIQYRRIYKSSYNLRINWTKLVKISLCRTH